MPTLGPLEIIIVLVIFAMFVAVAYVLVIGLARLVHRDDTTKRDPAIDALRTRFANGDIDQAEFERLRSVLHRG